MQNNRISADEYPGKSRVSESNSDNRVGISRQALTSFVALKRIMPQIVINQRGTWGWLHRWGWKGIGALYVVAFLALGASANPVEKGLEIAREADRHDQGFMDSVAQLQMILKDAHGETSTRSLQIYTLEIVQEDRGDKILVIFNQPPDIKGTALLTHTYIQQQDDQWFYLPAFKRIKRISSTNKSGPFLGSEFAYEDFIAQEVAKYTYRYLREEDCNRLRCFVVERVPVDKYSGYSRQIAWIDMEEYRYQKVEFYDRKHSLLKTLVFSNYRQYLDTYWRALTLDMKNHQTNKETQMLFSNYRFQTGLTDRDFTSSKLKQIR